jgi:ribosomal protein L11 methyltransferase
VRVSAERAEEARAVMLELFPEGFEELDVDGELELAAYTTAGGEERLWQVFGPGASTDVETGWTEAWKRFHRPTRVGPLWIGPPWEAAPADVTPVVIDPGRAFGTGAHPTTRLSLELVLELPRGSLVDIGCGSGVIAIAAAKLGFEPVVALDADEAAVETARANSVANGVDIEVRRADALRDALPASEIAVANITLADRRAPARDVRLPGVGTAAHSGTRPGRSTRDRGLGGRPFHAGVASIAPTWRRSRSTSSAARCRTRTHRRSKNVSSPRATWRAVRLRPTSWSSTPAASRTKRCGNRDKLRGVSLGGPAACI